MMEEIEYRYAITEFSNVNNDYEGSIVKSYIEDYATLLNRKYNISVIGKLPDINTLKILGLTMDNDEYGGNFNTTYKWAYNTRYWTSPFKTYQYDSNLFNYTVTSSGTVIAHTYYSKECGVRPLIEADTSILNNLKLKIYDYSNGNIEPTINEDNVILNIKANEGYKLKSIKVNDVDMTNKVSNNELILNNITENKIVKAEFEKITYTITTQVSEGGTITPQSPISVKYGESQQVTITPELGYKISSIKVNGVDRTSELNNGVLELSNIKTDTKIEVEFEKITYTINIQTNEGGTINPQSPIAVKYGESQELTITPEVGYKIKIIKVNGVDKTSELNRGVLALSNIKADTKVEVEFEAEVYEFTEGQNAKYNNEDIKFKLNGKYSLFYKLYVNEKELSKDNYIITEGSTIITLKKEYLATLEPGTYKLKATYTNGASDETTFIISETASNTENNEIQDETSTIVNTGDNIIFYGVILIISVFGTVIVLLKKRSKN